MASPATIVTSTAFTMTTMPYAVLTRSRSGTSTSTVTTPVSTMTPSSQNAALAYSRIKPRMAAGSRRQATAARSVYSSIPAHITAGSRWQMVSSAPPTGTMPSGWARMASATTTPSSGSTLSPGWRSRSAAAASRNATHSAAMSSPWPTVTSAATAGCAGRASSARAANTTPVSTAVAAAPSSAERSAHGVGSGAGPVPRYCRARPRPARPPSAPARPASMTQRRMAIRTAATTGTRTSWHPPATRSGARGVPGGRPPGQHCIPWPAQPACPAASPGRRVTGVAGTGVG